MKTAIKKILSFFVTIPLLAGCDQVERQKKEPAYNLLSIKTMPTKTEYTAFETFEKAGLILKMVSSEDESYSLDVSTFNVDETTLDNNLRFADIDPDTGQKPETHAPQCVSCIRRNAVRDYTHGGQRPFRGARE